MNTKTQQLFSFMANNNAILTLYSAATLQIIKFLLFLSTNVNIELESVPLQSMGDREVKQTKTISRL